MNNKKIVTIFEKFKLIEAAPKTELEFTTPFTLLVAVVLSAQATDVSVNKATKSLFKIADTPQKILKLGEAGLKSYIKTIGLYNAKAKNIILLCQKLIKEHGSKVPCTREDLMALPGVGRKTANVVLNCAFGEPTMAVDTHVFRVANRIGLTKAKNPLESEEQLVAAIPRVYMDHAHHWLILHGRYVCKARKPECWRCVIREECEYPDKTPAPE